MDFSKRYYFGYACWIAAILIFPARSATGQSAYFEKLTTRDGLSQNTINCIYQDGHGFLWLGTQDGLNRFDGHDFTVYRHSAGDSGSITHNWIWDVIEDGKGSLWVATWNGLNRLPPDSNDFIRYYSDSTSGYLGDRPSSFSIDSQGDLWIGTWGMGLNRYDHEKDEFRHFRLKRSASPTDPVNLVRDILHDEKGRLWLGTWDGLYRVDPGSFENTGKRLSGIIDHYEKIELPDDRITCLARNRDGKIWIGTLEGGLHRFDPDLMSLSSFSHEPGNPASIPGNDISGIAVDTKGDLWIGTFSNGVGRLQKKGFRIENIQYDSKNPESLGGNEVNSLFVDRSGLVWIGANALNKYNPRRERFNHMMHDPGNPSSLSHNNISAIYQSSTGEVWIGTEGGGINLLDLKNLSLRRFDFRDKNGRKIGNMSVGSVIQDQVGRIWAGTRRDGLFLMEREGEDFRPYVPVQSMELADSMKYINSLCTDSAGNLWIASFNHGLFRLDIHEGKLKNFKNDPENEMSLPGNYLLRLFRDRSDKIWIASWGGGLSVYDQRVDRFHNYLARQDDSTAIADNIVYTVHCSMINGREVIWAGTGAGVSYAFLDNWPHLQFRTLTVTDGLPNNTVYSIQDDLEGKIWITTNSGLCRYDPVSGRTRNYFQEDGLQANEFNGGAGLRTSGGKLIFGGINGLNIFDPRDIQDETFTPGLRIISLYVLNELYAHGRELYDEHVKLDHRQNFFSVGFSALDFHHPENIRYAYRLEGIDRDWVYPDNGRLATYTDIKPGDYVFRVRSTNCDQVWQENDATLLISIKPPYWQTGWFRGILIFIFLLLVYVAHRIRVQKILEMERLRMRIASDLHDDFGSALTRISLYSEQIRAANRNKAVELLSRRIGETSREVISSMSDIVWSIDSRNDTIRNLLDRIQEVNVNLESVSEIELTFRHFGMLKNKVIPVDYRQNIYYIYKESINNILKHASATRVDVLLDNRGRHFRMYIRDNGAGFDPEQIREGNGLRNMRSRAERIGGRLTVHSSEGTEIRLEMDKL